MKKRRKARQATPAREDEALEEQAALAAIYGSDFSLLPDGSGFSVLVRASQSVEGEAEAEEADAGTQAVVVVRSLSPGSAGSDPCRRSDACPADCCVAHRASSTASATRGGRPTCTWALRRVTLQRVTHCSTS
jgi:hypothetical protein